MTLIPIRSFGSSTKRLIIGYKLNPPGAFSLVEVVIALGLCVFALVALVGLFQVGLVSARESEEQVQTANLASQILAIRTAAPLIDFNNAPIPSTSLTNSYASVYSNKLIASDGRLTTDPRKAVCSITCAAGTNALTGPRTAQVSLELSWPPQASGTNSKGRYDILSFIPLH